MNSFQAILWSKRRMAYHALASVRNESKLKMGVVGSAALLLWFGILRAFHWSFDWLQTEGFEAENTGETIGLADILMTQLLSIFALALFFMLIFSNILISFSTLYKANEVRYLMLAPISIRLFFLARFIECVSFSSWASAYLGSPLILAYGLVTDAHWGYYVAAVFFYLPFVTIPAAMGSSITIFLVRIFPKMPRVVLFFLSISIIATFFLYLREKLNAESIADSSVLDLLQASSQSQSIFLPSFWASHGVLSAAQNQYSESLFMLSLLMANALMATWLVTELANRLFRPGFSALIGSDKNFERPMNKGLLGKMSGIFFFLRNPYRSLVVKDFKLFWRDPVQWTQFFLFFGIMAVYGAFMGNQSGGLRSEIYRSWIASLNSASCALILASLTSRFVYPLVSLEGFRFWILGLAPFNKKQLIWQKYWMSVATTSPFTVGLTLLTGISLQVSSLQLAISLYTIILANLSLSGLAIGLGSIYPNFDEDNPARIVSGMGGTLNLLLSVGYISLVIGSQMILLVWNSQRTYFQGDLFWKVLAGVIIFNSLISFLSVWLPMKYGLRNLEKTEF
jgi:ABC-2 type transport system permease protein